jgi:hypothetical protein
MSATRITWVVGAPLRRLKSGHISSDVAQMRYRVLIPISVLNRVGYQNQILTVLSDQIVPDAFRVLETDTVIFSGMASAGVGERLAAHARQHGARVILDFSGMAGEAEALARDTLMKQAHHVTCASAAMAQHVRRHAACPVTVIHDPYEGFPGAPSLQPGAALQLLWFGQGEDFPALEALLPQLARAAAHQPIRLSVMTRLAPELLQRAARLTEEDGLTLRMLPWSLQAQWKALADCDAVVLPEPADARHETQSHSRLIEALRAGRAVLAKPLASYEPFHAWIWTGEDFGEGVRWLHASRPKIPFLVQLAQDYIDKTFSPQVVAAQWERVMLGATH